MFHGSISERIALTQILLSPDGQWLSPECAQLCAILLMNPQVETTVELAKRNYQNPRGLPEKWIENYLKRDPAQLALDVMRVYDGHFKQQRTMRWMKLTMAGLGVLNALLATVAGTLALLKFL